MATQADFDRLTQMANDIEESEVAISNYPHRDTKAFKFSVDTAYDYETVVSLVTMLKHAAECGFSLQNMNFEFLCTMREQ